MRQIAFLTRLSICFAACASVHAANLVPDDFVGDNAGGFCGWDTRGAPIVSLAESGPDGRRAVRIAGTTESVRFSIPYMRLAAGGRFCLSADVRTKGLGTPKRVDLLVYTASWSSEEVVAVPRDTAGEWKRISREFTMPESRDGQYTLAVYASDAFADGAFLDIAGVRLEPVDEKARAGSVAVAASEPFKPRISPVDPLLCDVSADRAKLTFFYPGDLSVGGERLVLRAKMSGRTVTGEFGGDHKATVDFGAVGKGYRRIELEVVGEGSGKVFASNGYTVKVNATVRNATPAKKLNNFVSELFVKRLENGETPFVLAKDEWVYVALDRPYSGVSVDVDDLESALRFREGAPSETQRYLAAGQHVLKVNGVDAASKGGTLRVRLVKTIGGASFSRAIDANGDSLCWGYTRGYYDRFGLYDTINTAELKFYGRRTMMRIAAQLCDRGIKMHFASGPHSKHPSRNGVSTLYEEVATNPAFGHGVALALDENAIAASPRMKYNYSEAAWLLGERCHELAVWYADGFCELFNRPFLDIPELSAIVNSGDGLSQIYTEAYYIAPNTEDEWTRLADWIKLQRRQIRDDVPGAPSRYVYALSGWEYPGVWTTRHRPHVDLKAFYSRLLRLYATDPDFADIGGVSFTTPICDEDLVRFYYAAARHYCLEGRTDDFAETLGYEMLCGQVKNGDFDDGLAGWKVSAAEPGSVDVGHIRRFGMDSQRRMSPHGGINAGDRFALMTRSAKAPNVLGQTLSGLKPGGLYQISCCSMYYDDMLKPGSVRKKTAGVRVSVTGAEHIEDLDHVVCLRGSKAGEPERSATFVHRLVFRATGESAEMAISDWLEPSAPGGDAGERTAVNYVGCTAYYVRGPEDLKTLCEINLATGKGCHP